MAGYISIKDNGAKIPYKKYLQARPIRNENVEWERLNSDVIKLYMPYKKSPLMKIVSRVVDIPEERSFRFNPMGSMIWEMCDGKNTVEDIKGLVARRTKSSDKDVEKRLSRFLNKLIRSELISLETN